MTLSSAELSSMATSRGRVTREDSLELLHSDSMSDRLAGARHLAVAARPSDIPVLRQAQARESDWWVQRALERALDRARSGSPGDTSAVREVETEVASDLRAEAIQEVTSMLLHELHHLVGMIDVAASRDVSAYEESRTFAAVERTKGFLRAVQLFRDAAGIRRDADIDLTEVVSEIVREEGYAERIRLARSDAVIVRGDAALIRLVIVNALRNAVESTEAVTDRSPAVPIINWGVTDRDAWVALLDEGGGLPEGVESLWAPGVSGKDKTVHDGFGLAIARQAAESLGGKVELRPRAPSGAVCELSWAQP